MVELENKHDVLPTWQLIGTPDGFRLVMPRPSAEVLKQYYDGKYYSKGETTNQYTYDYTDAELRHKNLAYAEAAAMAPALGNTYLDLGCGEGFGLAYFSDLSGYGF